MSIAKIMIELRNSDKCCCFSFSTGERALFDWRGGGERKRRVEREREKERERERERERGGERERDFDWMM